MYSIKLNEFDVQEMVINHVCEINRNEIDRVNRLTNWLKEGHKMGLIKEKDYKWFLAEIAVTMEDVVDIIPISKKIW